MPEITMKMLLDMKEKFKEMNGSPVIPVKKKLFDKFFPDIENIDDYKLIVPANLEKEMKKLGEYSWLIYDRYGCTDNIYAVDFKAIMEYKF